MTQQQEIDDKIKTIMQTLAADVVVNVFDSSIQLLALLDANILSPRQIAMKMSSYSVNPVTCQPYTISELNLMYYGQDLSASNIYVNDILVPNPGYTAYLTETEDMVTNQLGYEPIDIRDQLKDKIHEIVREVRKELLNFESSLKHLLVSLPRAITQTTSGLTALVTPQKQMPPLPLLISNPASATQIAMNLHNVAHILRKEVTEGIIAVRIFSAGLNPETSHLTLGANFDNNVKVPEVKIQGINGAPPVKGMVKKLVPQVPKINFLLPDAILELLYDIFSAILDILEAAATLVVGLDTVSLILEAASLITNPGGLATLVAEVAALTALQAGISTAVEALKSQIKASAGDAVSKVASATTNDNLSSVASNADSQSQAAKNTVSITPADTTLVINHTTQLTIPTPGGQWSSSNKNIVSVDPDNGNIYAKNIGSVIISYNASSIGVTATASVTVIKS